MPQSFIETPDLESKAIASRPSPRAQLQGERIVHFTNRPFSQLFEEQVAHDPSRLAVICEDEELTFGQLNARSNQLARYLRALGVGRESLVGICIDRTADMAVGILGILKAGAAYLPLDPEYPKERLTFMMSDARPAAVLTRASLENRLRDNERGIVLLDKTWAEISEQSDANLTEGPLPEDLAYVIYTSGSTGNPKGVMIEHRNLSNYLLALDHELKINRDDRYLHMASIAFSSSRRQLMLPLSQGAAVVIATSDERKDPLALFQMMRDRGVTVMDAVPSFWRSCTTILASLEDNQRQALLDNKLRLMLSASEPLLSDIPRIWMTQFQHSAQHVHMFGQTETAGIVCAYRVPDTLDTDAATVPIGNPIANTEICVLDEEQRPCEVGVAGELYIGGAGVGRGYLNQPELTAEKFIPHPFDDRDGSRLYRTGDWARCNVEGEIEFAGRRDQQVKLRGFRIELGEVEATLCRHPAVRESVVIARGNGADKRLLAYFVSEENGLKTAELRSFLSKRLPDYAVPSVFVQMDALPLSANGKVNRLALPEAEGLRSGLSTEFVAPHNDVEERLASIWCDVLRVECVGVNDNFFELGGHSLLAAQIVARVRREFRHDLPLRTLFEGPTVTQMAASLAIAGQSASALLSIEPAARNGKAPLSFTQQQFWLLGLSEPNSAYNVRTAINIRGALDQNNLRRALDTIVQRHEILRTNIVVIEGSPVQVIAPAVTVAINLSDIRNLSRTERETEIRQTLAEEAERPFDLGQGPLLRTRLIKLGEDEHVFILTIHHIICDAWSVRVLLSELVTLYKNFTDGRSASLPQLAIQYADFAIWQRTRLQDKALESSLLYWKQQLSGASPKLDLPTDYPRSETPALHGAETSIHLPPNVSTAIKSLSQQEGATLFMTLLAAFQTLLFRYSGQEDIVVGSPVAGRSMLETEGLIGAFVNTLVLRGQLSGNPTFAEFLGRVRESTLGAFSHQEVPFEKLVQELNPERSVNSSPLFQVMFALQNSPTADITAEGLTLTPIKLNSVTSKFDLSLEVEEDNDGMCFSCEYNSDLFAPETIERMLRHFQNLLEAIVADPSQRVGELPLLDDSERHQLLVEWNQTREDLPTETCIHQLFEAQVERTPAAIAVEFQDRQMTYDELNRRANQLANYLQKQGVGPEVLVGVCIERSVEMLVGVLGVLKAGGAYVPLDPTYPRDRIAFMIQDAGLSLVLTKQNLTKDIPSERVCLLCLEEEWETIAQETDQNPFTEVTPQNLAYVIYTSGSTGNPKGVMVEHSSLVSFTLTAAADYEVLPGDRILQFASLCFDLSAEEIYPALTNGATLVLRTDGMISSPRDFLRCCDQWKLTILDLPTSYWHELTVALSEESLVLPDSVRLVIIGGEKASLDRVNTWHQAVSKTVRLVNTYGPTETTVVATIFDLGKKSESTPINVVPIGRPIRNASAFILDEMRQPVPIGVAGELYVGGAGVARGYVSRPQLTTEKFIADPFSADQRDRLYKTGDLVRYLPDGNIEFLGRIDNQVKIRGFRVELEEIEQALRSHSGVTDVVVVLDERHDGDKRLVAYVVPNIDALPAISELRNFLKEKLPAHMVPAIFETIDALPLMPNGKIDRRALPEPRQQDRQMDEAFVAPRTPIEQLLADVWSDVLKLDRISIHDNFFELGGHSLLAARVVSNVRNSLEVELCMVDVFQAPTIASLALLLYPRRAQAESEDDLANLLEELSGLTDETAQEHFDREVQITGAVAA